MNFLGQIYSSVIKMFRYENAVFESRRTLPSLVKLQLRLKSSKAMADLSPTIEALYDLNKSIRDDNVHIHKRHATSLRSVTRERPDSTNAEFLELVKGEPREARPPITRKSPQMTPRTLKEYLDKYVIGQEACKRMLSVAVYNHILRAKNMMENELAKLKTEGLDKLASKTSDTSEMAIDNLMRKPIDEKMIGMDKANVMMIGPSGSGKTLMAQMLAKAMNLPIIIQDCTALTQAGYVGEDVESCVMKLFAKAEYDVNQCERGIIVLDEVDKLSRQEVPAGTKDIGGVGVQQALLKLIEGTPVVVQARTNESEEITIDTSKILFIVMGAFVGLDKLVCERLAHGTSSNGTRLSQITLKNGTTVSALHRLHSEDLIKYGMIPEFIGRIPIVGVLDDLDVDDLEEVLTKTKRSLGEQYRQMFSQLGIKLHITKPAYREIARLALENGTGARGLQSILSKMLVEANFECPGSKTKGILLDRGAVKEYSESLESCNVFRPKYFDSVTEMAKAVQREQNEDSAQ